MRSSEAAVHWVHANDDRSSREWTRSVGMSRTTRARWLRRAVGAVAAAVLAGLGVIGADVPSTVVASDALRPLPIVDAGP